MVEISFTRFPISYLFPHKFFASVSISNHFVSLSLQIHKFDSKVGLLLGPLTVETKSLGMYLCQRDLGPSKSYSNHVLPCGRWKLWNSCLLVMTFSCVAYALKLCPTLWFNTQQTYVIILIIGQFGLIKHWIHFSQLVNKINKSLT